MKFRKTNLSGMPSMLAYTATSGQWTFLILCDREKWSASYRLTNPTGTVSASSTIMGPFDEFYEAATAAETKLAELRRLA